MQRRISRAFRMQLMRLAIAQNGRQRPQERVSDLANAGPESTAETAEKRAHREGDGEESVGRAEPWADCGKRVRMSGKMPGYV